MHLRAIKLRGFKSFPDPVEVRLEPGVAVVVGPNGSGKSNVADGIVWAAGSLAPSELRAEKPDDVLFAGGGGRSPEDFCEVELVFDNPDGDGLLPYSELSVARRLHRGGEGQYLLNRTAVRRIDLVELLADLGLGGGMHSIIGQGRVEEILGSKPAERRELLEEAAGLGRFKKRKHRAELKLARVAIQVERARDVEAEVKKRLRPLALQATAAERAEKLRGEIASLRARVAELDLEELRERLEDGEGRRTAAVLASRQRRPSTACAVRASGWSSGSRAPRRCSGGFVPSSPVRVASSTCACAPSGRPCGSKLGSRANDSRHSSARSPNGKDFPRRRAPLPRRASDLHSRSSTSNPETSVPLRRLSGTGRLPSWPKMPAPPLRWPNARALRAWAASSSSRAIPPRWSASFRSCRRRSCCTRRFRP